MPSRRRTRRRPATTVAGREGQLITLAIDLAEKQLIDGTASSQVTSHFLKLGSTREALEQERLRHENLLVAAKIEELKSRQKVEELYADALVAMKRYQGETVDEEPDAD